MAVFGDIVSDLIRAGVAPELVSRVAAAIAEARAEGAICNQRSARQDRNQRYYEARKERLKTSESVLNKTNKTVSDGSRAPRAPAFSIGEEVDITPSVANATQPPRGRETRGLRLPDNFTVSDDVRAFGQSFGLSDAEIDACAAEFVDYWLGVPGARGRKLNWDATFRNRLRDVAGKTARSKGQFNGQDRRSNSVSAAAARLADLGDAFTLGERPSLTRQPVREHHGGLLPTR